MLDKDMVNIEAIKALGEIGDSSAIEPLKQVLNSEKDKTLKTIANKSLKKIERKNQ